MSEEQQRFARFVWHHPSLNEFHRQATEFMDSDGKLDLRNRKGWPYRFFKTVALAMMDEVGIEDDPQQNDDF